MPNRYQPSHRVLRQTLLYRSIMNGLEWDHDLSNLPNRFCLEPHQQPWNVGRIGA